MLLFLYILFAFFCVGLINRRLRVDPLLVVLPCTLLVVADQATFLSIYISLLPITLLLALKSVVEHYRALTIEHITRLGTGLSLGAFIALQSIFLFDVPLFLLLAGLAFVSLLSVLVNKLRWPAYERITNVSAIWFGLVLGVVQFLGLGSGLALLGAREEASDANRSALWLLGSMGAFLGVVALPTGQLSGFDWLVFSWGGVGALLGSVLAQRIKISSFESSVLVWVVLCMCFSIWVHLFIKLSVFS